MSSPYDSQSTDSDSTNTQQPEVALRGDGADLAQHLSDDAQRAQEHLQEKVSDVAEKAADQARGFAEQQKQGGAERIDDAASAVHRAADEIAKESPLAGRYMHAGAEQLHRASRMLRENSLDELYRMTNRFAHERPFAFIGGSVAAGFALARILRSSASAPAMNGSTRHEQ